MILWTRASNELLETATSITEKARLRASRHWFSSHWLKALPSSQVGTLLDPLQFRVSACLRLGGPLCRPHSCAKCGGRVNEDGLHGLVCARGEEKHIRHASINETISRGLDAARVPNRREPNHLSLTGNERPDGVTLIPWAKGRTLVWDATVICTLAASYVEVTASEVGAAARIAERRKHTTYRALETDYDVVPVAFETHGPLGKETEEFLIELRKRVKKERGGAEGAFFFQRLSLCIQRGNSIAVIGAMGLNPDALED